MSQVGIPNHHSIVDDDHIEWLADLPDMVRLPICRRLAKAEFMHDTRQISYIHKIIKLQAAGRGKRASGVQAIAMGQEAIQMAAEMIAPRRDAL